jgi:diguanylate cyclase (GGDEF)-like protein
MEDISERRVLLDRLAFLVEHDDMTGLLNRRGFEKELGRQVAHARRYEHPAALLMLDLDNFKEINDTLGHHIGDELVKRIAERLRSRMRGTDLVARVGGDEFAILLPETGHEAAEHVAGEILRHIAEQPIVLDSLPLWTRASVGIALFDPARADDTAALLMQADAAMYEAKGAGGHSYAVAGRDRDPDPAPAQLEVEPA